MSKLALITGGAGFIGSHLSNELLGAGYKVRVLDRLDPQVHGGGLVKAPKHLDPKVELFWGDVRDVEDVQYALKDVDVVFHLAAKVGVGQSMYQIRSYCATNDVGTAVLLEAMIRNPVESLVVASSMSVYGEGATGFGDSCMIHPIPTPESMTPNPTSIYALNKYFQEKACLIFGEAYHIPTVALRFFNVYGPGQALSNPYTGVMAIFASRLLNGKPPIIYEDGRQKRDFVSVYDVARACRLAAESDEAPGRSINIGSGEAHTVLEVCEAMREALGVDVEPEITGKFRAGDIRHCFADISLARKVLGYEPQVRFSDGVRDLCEWLKGQKAVDRTGEAAAELASRGLVA